MVLLPVVERELRVASRGRAAYRVRFWAVLVMLALFVWFLKTSGLDQNNSRFGTAAMTVLLFPAFVLSLFIGVIATADCVSSEKREGTLGLLFLTDLSGWDVALGKLCANSLKSFYAVLGAFPVYGCPTILCGLAAVALRLNLPALQLVNQMATPVQIALLLPFSRTGSWIFGYRAGFGGVPRLDG